MVINLLNIDFEDYDLCWLGDEVLLKFVKFIVSYRKIKDWEIMYVKSFHF